MRQSIPGPVQNWWKAPWLRPARPRSAGDVDVHGADRQVELCGGHTLPRHEHLPAPRCRGGA